MATAEVVDRPQSSTVEGISAAQPNLALWRALLNMENDASSHGELFSAFEAVFHQQQALLFEAQGDALICTASTPASFEGKRCPKETFEGVLEGRIVVTSN